MKTFQHFLIIGGLLLFCAAVRAQGTAFTYQGRLHDNGSAGQGLYDLKFTIFDAPVNGAALAGPITNAATGASNGLFTVTLDFGAGVFDGPDRWLEMGVRTNGGGAFTTLSPRQKLTPTPYAIRAANFSGSVAASQLTGTLSSSNIGAGTITGPMLAAGSITAGNLAAGSVTGSSLANGAVSLNKLDAVPVPLGFVTINNPTPASEEFFGRSVAAVGNDRVLVGAHTAFSGGQPGAGEAYLFNANGTLLTTLTNPAPVFSGGFGAAVASAGGNHILIGAGVRPGIVSATNAYLFSTNGTLITTFTNPSGASNDFFGTPVAAVGTDKVLIGAPDNDTAATNSGAAYLFSTNGALLFTYTNPTPLMDDVFGIAVAAVGNDHVLIGTLADTGGAYLFHTSGALVTTFTKPTPFASDSFGASLAAFGNDRVLVGAESDDTAAVNTGAAHLFSTNGTRLMTFTNPAPAVGDRFGVSVASVGTDKVLIGAYADDAGATNSGSAYLFDTNGTLLASFANPTPALDDQFGFDVAGLGSDRVIVGAHRDSTGAPRAGAAYIFTTEQGALMSGLFAGGVAAGAVTPAMLSADVGVWSRSGSNLYYTAGNVGVGTNAPASRLHVSGTVTATALSGGGSGLTGLNASQLTSGTVPGGRLAGTYSGAVTFNNAANSFSGDSAGLTGLNASQLTSGTVPLARLPAAMITNNQNGVTLTGAFAGNGSGLTNVPGAWQTNGSILFYNAGNVGIGTANPQTALQVNGGIRFGAGGASYPPAGLEDLRIVRGVVSAAGTILAGSGFTVTYTGLGAYTVTFDTAFAGLPTISATVQSGLSRLVTSTSVGAGSAQFRTFISNIAAAADHQFHFIAIGPR